MSDNWIEKISKLKSAFDTGFTHDIKQRKQVLNSLYLEIDKNTDNICDAVYKDFHKSKEEMLITEIYPVLSEIKHTISHLNAWAKADSVLSNMLIQPSRSKIYKSPKGVVLIFAPWNYSFYLALMPFVSAISAGNVVVLKPAHETPHVSQIIKEIIEKVFSDQQAIVVLGEGKTIGEELLNNYRFDHVFFTGSPKVGSWIAQKVSEKLTPFTLELGGKSPAIIHESANLDIAAKRTVWGKYLNAGQTCVAPDYVLVHSSIENTFLDLCKKYIIELFGEDALNSPKYTHIINENRFDKVISYLHDGELIFGGKYDKSILSIEPTVLKVSDINKPVMQEEIFGPVLPVMIYNNYEELISLLRQNRNPLSFYIFTKDNMFERKLISDVEYGGGCINNVILHLGNPRLPFGGIQQSGNGNYHGKWGFDTFSNIKPMVHYARWFDLSLLYHPYTINKVKVIKRFFGL